MDTAFRVTLAGGAGFRYLASANDVIGRALYWRGLQTWEHETLPVFEALARRARGVLDVGANTGVYALLACAANPDARVLAFEPIPRVFARLVQNVDANHWSTRCECHPMAVSDHDGSTRFHQPSVEFPTSGSLDRDGFRGLEGELIDVEVRKLDSVCADDLPVDLVKIDVEGFEHKALGGMSRILAEYHPDLILECNPDGPVAAIESILQPLGYQFVHLDGGELAASDHIVPDASERARNFLCTARADWRARLASPQV